MTSPIDLLLEGDVYGSLMEGWKVSIDNTLPAEFSSVFGCILISSIVDTVNQSYQSLPICMTASIEGCCEQIFRDEMRRLPSGRLAVPLPFREPAKTHAWRFDALERKLSSNPLLKSLYVNSMSEYIALGHMSVATSPGRYIIHHHAITGGRSQ